MKILYRKELKFKTIIYLNVFNMNQTKGNKCSRFFALLLAGVLSVASLSAQAQNRTIKGCITDANNKEPLMGATITLDGGKTGAVTDLDGNYTLVVPAGTKQITVSYIGYIAKPCSSTAT